MCERERERERVREERIMKSPMARSSIELLDPKGTVVGLGNRSRLESDQKRGTRCSSSVTGNVVSLRWKKIVGYRKNGKWIDERNRGRKRKSADIGAHCVLCSSG